MTPEGKAPPEGDEEDDRAAQFRLDLYRIAIEEYRFQVDLNWKRTEHWFTLNVAIAGAAIALLHISKSAGTFFLIGMVFLTGVFACLVAVVAIYVQHTYYRGVRDRMMVLGEAVSDPPVVTTTRGMRRGPEPRARRKLRAVAEWLPNITTLYQLLLVFLMVLDLGGAIYAGVESKKAHDRHHQKTPAAHSTAAATTPQTAQSVLARARQGRGV